MLRLRLADINALVVKNGYAAIVVNPGGPWAAMSAADLGVLVARVNADSLVAENPSVRDRN